MPTRNPEAQSLVSADIDTFAQTQTGGKTFAEAMLPEELMGDEKDPIELVEIDPGSVALPQPATA